MNLSLFLRERQLRCRSLKNNGLYSIYKPNKFLPQSKSMLIPENHWEESLRLALPFLDLPAFYVLL
jgi:hypothetical protein